MITIGHVVESAASIILTKVSMTMNLDDEICYCYHVSLRKLINFARRTKPARPSQMTQCLGAGTGCGWCIPFLIKIAQDSDHKSPGQQDTDFSEELQINSAEYAEQRKNYRASRPKNTFE